MHPKCLVVFVLSCSLLGACTEDADSGSDDEVGDEEEEEPECSAEQMMRVDTVFDLTADETAGAMVFMQICGSAACHGADGSAGPAPDLPDEVPEFDDVGLACLLLNGEGDMPSQATLSDQQLADVIAYVQSTF
jgi:hypothetical protein